MLGGIEEMEMQTVALNTKAIKIFSEAKQVYDTA